MEAASIVVSEPGVRNRCSEETVASPNTFLDGLDQLDQFASARGWTIVGQDTNELVHFGAPAASTAVDETSRTIQICLTADRASKVRAVEFADEVSHAVNAIRGVPDGNSAAFHIRNFSDAANSTLIPYTAEKREPSTVDTAIRAR